MKNQKGFVAVPILIAIILGILAVGGGAYFVVKKKTTTEINPNIETVYQCPNGQVQFGGSECSNSATQNISTTTPILKVVSWHSEGPATITVSYENLPKGVTALAVCMEKGSCTEWVEPFTPETSSGTYTMSVKKAFGPDSQKGLGTGKQKIVAIGSKFNDQLLESNVFDVGDNKEQTNQTGSVPGMSKYTDNNFGFSFWYPSTKEVKIVSSVIADSESWYGSGTKILKTINAPDFVLVEVYSPSMSILSSTDAGCCGSRDNRYFFDKQAHLWMKYDDGGPIGRPAATTTVNISDNTMGGLHVFSGYTRFGIRVIVPLSAHNFLVLYSKCNGATDYLCSSGQGSGTDKFEKSVHTIVATDLAVATPVSIDEQIKTIKAEASAYGVKL